MEGIAVKNFDMRLKYAVAYTNHGTWHVIRKEIADRFEYCSGENIAFKCAPNWYVEV